MCACNGTGVIQNGIGMGMYQFGPCVCEAANISPQEVDRRREAVIAKLKKLHKMQMEGKTYGNSTAPQVHEGITA
ncbi:TPA: hypothetical protein ACOQ9V_004675 [Bacillus cereus]|uniref:hypothetical protein n=1 Tax=Bacillus cereus TaxID=1396 RepID=UPI00192571FC|nr:hypothetical protein [Bacillus cereus]MBL3768670.1 hypothetical protein [Bacillus cereus]MBL3881177.1 hypothetical protein [Bacillus cereus]HDR7980305.1 hypothetical protein [Bacillus cereus]